MQVTWLLCKALHLKNFPGGSDGKESTCNAGDLGSIPRSGRSPGDGIGYPLQYSGLENSMDYIVGHDSVTFTCYLLAVRTVNISII